MTQKILSNKTGLDPAKITWNNNQPVSEQFADIYFSSFDGLAESRYVFLQHNQLPSRWSNWKDSLKNHFTIIETGFGTGLNFLASWDLWRALGPRSCRLHYISVEKYPLSLADLTLALSQWPELSPLAEQVLAKYPAPVAGAHRLAFEDGSVQLTLLLGDAEHCLASIDTQADAWFLDGFAPAKNPEMWSHGLFKQISRLSYEQSSFSTFTAASWVRKQLQLAGFQVERSKGFKHKREMLHGHFLGQPRPTHLNAQQSPWFKHQDFYTGNGQKVLVIGGGLAGTTTAYTLANKGFKVELIERAERLASAASGNPLGVLFTKLNPEPSIHNSFYQQSYAFAIDHLQALEKNTLAKNILQWQQCGMLQLAFSEKEKTLQQQIIQSGKWSNEQVIAVSADEASHLSGINQQHGALFLPQSGWVDPASFCNAQVKAHPAITVRCSQTALRLDYSNKTWSVYNDKDELISSSDIVIIANSLDASLFSQTAFLPLKSLRGQVSVLPLSSASQSLRTLLNYDGYASPAYQGYHCVGATFHHNDTCVDVRYSDHKINLEQLQRACPAFHDALTQNRTLADVRGRTAFRCQPPDYLPVVGPVPNLSAFTKDYHGLRTGKLKQDYPMGQFLPGLFVNIAYGSRGLTSAAFCAEILASHVNGEPQPTEQAIVHALHPARFIIRNLKRRTL